jgi:hypothetical protein
MPGDLVENHDLSPVPRRERPPQYFGERCIDHADGASEVITRPPVVSAAVADHVERVLEQVLCGR